MIKNKSALMVKFQRNERRGEERRGGQYIRCCSNRPDLNLPCNGSPHLPIVCGPEFLQAEIYGLPS